MTEQHGLRIGVLGTGWGTRISVPALRAEGWHVAALWSRNAERAEKQAAALGHSVCHQRRLSPHQPS